MNPRSESQASAPRASLALWLGLLGPPAVWLIAFEIKYSLAAAPVNSVKHSALIVAGLAALAIIAGLGLLSWREWRLASASPLDRYAGVVARIRFMALLGMMTSALFLLATAAQVLAPFFIAPGKT
jgi:hypothetical protein